MTSIVSGESVFTPDGTPIYSSPLVVNNSEGDVNIDIDNSQMDVDLVIEGDGPDEVYTSLFGDIGDITKTGAGDDIIDAGAENEYIDIAGSKGADIFEFKVDQDGGVFGYNSNLESDVFVKIRDFDPNEGDRLIFELEDMDGVVSYDKGSGEVKVTDSVGDESVVAEIADDLNVDVKKLGNGQWELW